MKQHATHFKMALCCCQVQRCVFVSVADGLACPAIQQQLQEYVCIKGSHSVKPRSRPTGVHMSYLNHLDVSAASSSVQGGSTLPVSRIDISSSVYQQLGFL
eukprot:TRINITY_DN8988_c0_g1_i2.p1 TRINITY_DN8988_c0_g1~~TRINITY_DN8988_c0_g1_i2.p1  ORF type:complete len:101 (-),score=21.92 TRINITY_DN8988_c0_g1_i2:158-460(-)